MTSREILKVRLARTTTCLRRFQDFKIFSAQMQAVPVLQAKRHQLYCSIADACQQTNVDSSDILGRLQAVLEAEACLSCIDGDAEADQHALEAQNSHASGFLGAAAPGAVGPGRQSPSAVRLTARAAASALHDLKEELAQRVHQSVQHQLQQKPRHGKVSFRQRLI